MQVHFGVEALRPEWEAAVGCIGTFDGVHRGHQAVISEAVRLAAQTERPSILVTFDRHPAATLAPERAPQPIGTLESNLAEFERLGISVAAVLAFDRALANVDAETFLDGLCRASLRIEHVVVGHDFAFGRGRVGTADWLRDRIETTVVPAFAVDGARVSSSAIRAAIAGGDVESANTWLGRPFKLSGVVVAGQKLGRKLGYPTANLARSTDQIVPKDGIYSAVASIGHGAYKAAVSIGRRPAVGGGDRTIEAHLLGFSGESLYGSVVELSLLARIRDELDFASFDALKDQMARDVAEVERVVDVAASLQRR